ncbi:MAG: hypothetical protein V1872_03695 [bacterium]
MMNSVLLLHCSKKLEGKIVPEISMGSLMLAIQAIRKEIQEFEKLLSSEDITNVEDVEELIFSYERAEKELVEKYECERKILEGYPHSLF